MYVSPTYAQPFTQNDTQQKKAAERSSLLFEERLDAASRRRLDGNALFAAGKLAEALGKYALVRVRSLVVSRLTELEESFVARVS